MTEIKYDLNYCKMTTRIPEALPATGGLGGITDTFGFDYINNTMNDASSAAIVPAILYPRSSTIFASICASIFTIIGIGGKKLK